MTAKRSDWLGLIEASYRLGVSNQQWLEGLVDRIVPVIDRPTAPVSIFTYRCTPTTFEILDVAAQGPPELAAAIRETNAAASEQEIDLIYRSGLAGGTLSETTFARFPGSREFFAAKTQGRFRDTFGWAAPTGSEHGLMINAALPAEENSTATERRRWAKAAAHLGAGLRLRARVSRIDLDDSAVEAILDSAGRLTEARGAAEPSSAQARLRAVVRSIDRARASSERGDADAAMQAWTALVNGRWSLVDHFDTDGKRFVVAVKNDPAFPDPRGLTARERQVAEFVGLGRTTKEIAYTLGLSGSSIDNSVARAAAKLGLSSRAELAAFFSPGGLRAKLAEVAVAGESLLVGAYPLMSEHSLTNLTGAERVVVAHLVAGSTNADIARRRNTSVRTVANQMHSIFVKLGVRSRSELAARLQALA